MYLFTTGQLLEGKQLCDEAVTLALSCGLHKIRSAQPARATNLVESASVLLPDPLDQIEEGKYYISFYLFILYNDAGDLTTLLRGALEWLLDPVLNGQVLGRRS